MVGEAGRKWVGNWEIEETGVAGQHSALGSWSEYPGKLVGKCWKATICEGKSSQRLRVPEGQQQESW